VTRTAPLPMLSRAYALRVARGHYDEARSPELRGYWAQVIQGLGGTI
jgi:hypothetical protein